MEDMNDRPSVPEANETVSPAAEDARLPYEAPRLLKKRSVARATLFTAMGPTTTAITMMG